MAKDGQKRSDFRGHPPTDRQPAGPGLAGTPSRRTASFDAAAAGGQPPRAGGRPVYAQQSSPPQSRRVFTPKCATHTVNRCPRPSLRGRRLGGPGTLASGAPSVQATRGRAASNGPAPDFGSPSKWTRDREDAFTARWAAEDHGGELAVLAAACRGLRRRRPANHQIPCRWCWRGSLEPLRPAPRGRRQCSNCGAVFHKERGTGDWTLSVYPASIPELYAPTKTDSPLVAITPAFNPRSDHSPFSPRGGGSAGSLPGGTATGLSERRTGRRPVVPKTSILTLKGGALCTN